MTNAMTVRQDMMPAMTIQEASSRYNALVEFTKTIMKKDKDYGVIPGTGTKPTLLKPGAEKLCSMFGFAPEFELMDSIRDFDKGLFYFQYRCVLTKNGNVVASGIGSCNSKEKKYRYRNIMSWEATEEDKSRAVAVVEKMNKYGKPYQIYKVENTETFDIVNTIDKMAQKRALVAATLIGANASEFFTQDVEDMDFVEGDFEIVDDPKPQPKTRPASSGHNFNKRPYDPETLQAALKVKADKIGTYNASEKQRNFLGSLLNEFYQDDARRHEASLYLFGAASTKDIDGAMVKAGLDWLNPQKDDGGAYLIDEVARKELSAVLDAAQVAQGQEALL